MSEIARRTPKDTSLAILNNVLYLVKLACSSDGALHDAGLLRCKDSVTQVCTSFQYTYTCALTSFPDGFHLQKLVCQQWIAFGSQQQQQQPTNRIYSCYLSMALTVCTCTVYFIFALVLQFLMCNG
ncbi:hypothetical protein DUNSADRAFT_11531 [Dunaliella salina]|uniref:Uncharacterized protein n=1 Tax=Dunaliella salina TaxID=3046 RepID=A0ABQ7GD45_DUNSA|nr:hypothetical protein DUNSADRAFT_11531 [Dunaliella salina]|eukprot:KAF5832537.1 hypothetical protein DUNSADRAFT_11531 [Dunaliella salina]